MILTDVLYPASFLMALLGLITWMLLPDSKGLSGLFRALFFIGSLTWVACVVAIDADVAHKAFIGARDMLALGIIGWLVQQARANRAVALALFIGTGFFVRFSYYDMLRNSFNQEELSLTQPELLVKWASQVPMEEVQNALNKYDVHITQAFHPLDVNETELDNYFMVDCPMGEKDKVQAKLKKLDYIEWVEENDIITLDDDLGDIVEAKKQKNDDPLLPQQWSMRTMQSALVHELEPLSGRPDHIIKIAILDTGVDAEHEDLLNNYVSTQAKYDRDPAGHGTHVAGIIAGVTGNGKGIASLVSAGFPQIQISSITVLRAFGGGTQESVIDGMIEAADKGAHIISMSLGARSTDEKQQAYNEAVAYCNSKGAIVVVSAGNSNNNAKEMAPANSQGVIAVAATDPRNRRAPFSSMVHDLEMGLAAPGVDIMSTWPGNRYRKSSGTSMAAPLVSSAVALLLCVDPTLDTQEVFRLLGATGLSSNQPLETGPIIQPAAAMQLLLSREEIPAPASE